MNKRTVISCPSSSNYSDHTKEAIHNNNKIVKKIIGQTWKIGQSIFIRILYFLEVLHMYLHIPQYTRWLLSRNKKNTLDWTKMQHELDTSIAFVLRACSSHKRDL